MERRRERISSRDDIEEMHEGSQQDIYPSTPPPSPPPTPTFNARRISRARRRKGIPHRAPFRS